MSINELKVKSIEFLYDGCSFVTFIDIGAVELLILTDTVLKKEDNDEYVDCVNTDPIDRSYIEFIENMSFKLESEDCFNLNPFNKLNVVGSDLLLLEMPFSLDTIKRIGLNGNIALSEGSFNYTDYFDNVVKVNFTGFDKYYENIKSNVYGKILITIVLFFGFFLILKWRLKNLKKPIY